MGGSSGAETLPVGVVFVDFFSVRETVLVERGPEEGRTRDTEYGVKENQRKGTRKTVAV